MAWATGKVTTVGPAKTEAEEELTEELRQLNEKLDAVRWFMGLNVAVWLALVLLEVGDALK